MWYTICPVNFKYITKHCIKNSENYQKWFSFVDLSNWLIKPIEMAYAFAPNICLMCEINYNLISLFWFIYSTLKIFYKYTTKSHIFFNSIYFVSTKPSIWTAWLHGSIEITELILAISWNLNKNKIILYFFCTNLIFSSILRSHFVLSILVNTTSKNYSTQRFI